MEKDNLRILDEFRKIQKWTPTELMMLAYSVHLFNNDGIGIIIENNKLVFDIEGSFEREKKNETH